MRKNINKYKAEERKKRIETLGGFGKKKTQVKKDKKKYDRKNMKKPGSEAGLCFCHHTVLY